MIFGVEMLNERIKELRNSRKMTQVELAKALGLTKQCISNWENDNVLPSVDMLCKLADFFSVTTDYLLCREEKELLFVEGLSKDEIVHIRQIVEDIKLLKH